MNHTYRKNNIWKRLTALVLAIMLLMPNVDLNNVAYGASGALEQFNLTFTNIQNAEKNSDTVYFVRKNAETSIDMKLQPHFTSGTAGGVEVTLGVPYIYFNVNNQIVTDYAKPAGIAEEDLMSLRMTPDTPSESWIIYGTDSTTVYNADQTVDPQDYNGKVIEEGKYFTGKVVIRYVNDLAAGDYTFVLKTRFYGSALPENTAANVRAGMSYTSYTSATGETTT